MYCDISHSEPTTDIIEELRQEGNFFPKALNDKVTIPLPKTDFSESVAFLLI